MAEARTPAFRTYAQAVADNAQALADGLLRSGAPKLVTGGTDNHLVLIDVSGYGLTGRQAESALLDAGIVTNRNAVPTDPNGAWYTSGVRIGTPALTTRGFGADEFDEVAELIVNVLKNTTPVTASTGQPGKAKYPWPTESPRPPRRPRPSCWTPTRCTRGCSSRYGPTVIEPLTSSALKGAHWVDGPARPRLLDRRGGRGHGSHHPHAALLRA